MIKTKMSSIQNNIKIIFLFFVISSCFAQKKQSNKSGTQQGYEITIKTENITNETLQLSFIYGTNKKSFVTDSIVIKNTIQKVVFKEPKKIVGAIYRLTLKSNPNNFLELALDNGSIINGAIANTNSFYATFFDEVQPSEKRLAFLPNINKLLYKFVTAKPITNENYIKHIDKLLKGLDCKTQNFKIFTKYLVANIAFFENNNLEETYNHLYEKYIKDNTCKVFSDTDMNKFSNEFESNKKVPLFSIFPELTFATKDSITTTIQ